MLKLENLTIKFGGLTAVNDVTTEVKKGEIFGLIGPNGAGKTTTFNMISGVFPPTSGKIIFKGEEIQGMPPNKVNYLGIARTYQNINLFKSMTALENIMVGRHSTSKASLWDALVLSKKTRAEEREILERAHEFLAYVGLDAKANYKAGSLPYGEQRRLEIARALASEPELLLLDEPAAGMNLTEKDELSELVMRIRDDGKTILLVEHNMKLVMKICDNICVLNFGTKIAEGTPKEIQNNPQVIESYLGGGTRRE